MGSGYKKLYEEERQLNSFLSKLVESQEELIETQKAEIQALKEFIEQYRAETDKMNKRFRNIIEKTCTEESGAAMENSETTHQIK